MTNRSPLGSPHMSGRLWRQSRATKRQAIFVPCPVAPPLCKPDTDDVTDKNVDGDDTKSLNGPNTGYQERIEGGLGVDYPEPLTPPVHLSEIIRQSSEDIEEEELPPPPPPLEMTAPSPPPPPPLPGGHPSGASTPPLPGLHPSGTSTPPPFPGGHPSGTSTPPLPGGHPSGTSTPPLPGGHPSGTSTPPTPKTPTTPTTSPNSKRWKITPKDLAKKANIFRFPPDKKTSAISKIKTQEASAAVSPPVPWTPPPGPQMLKKQTSVTKTDIKMNPSQRPPTAPPPPPPPPLAPSSLMPKEGALINQEDVKTDRPAIPSTPPSRTPSIDVTSEFPPPPPGVGTDEEPVSPSLIIPRKPPRPNSGFLAKIAKFSEPRKPSEVAADERRRRNEASRKIDTKMTQPREPGCKSDERMSVALHNSLEDLLSHINESLPGIEENPKGTPPETKTPANSLESSQEFLDHVGSFLATPGRDVTTITEEDMATKFDDTNNEIPAPSDPSPSNVNASSKLDTDEAENDINKFDDVFANLDDVNAQFDDDAPEKPVLDDDLAAFLGLDDLDDCLNQIDEAIGTQKSNQETESNQQPASLQTQPIGGAESGDSEDSEDYDYPIGNKATFSGPLPSESNGEPATTASNQASAASLQAPATGDVDSDEFDDSKDYEFPVGNQSTFSGPLPSGSFSETPDDPHYENSEFIRTCLLDRDAGIMQTHPSPTYPERDDAHLLGTQQSRDDSDMKCQDEDQEGLYDIPQTVQTSQVHGIQEVEADAEYDAPEVTDDIARSKKKEKTLLKQTSISSAPSMHGQTKVSSPKISTKVSSPKLLTKVSSPKMSKDRPPPPNDVPPKPQGKKTVKKKTWSWRKKPQEKAGKAPPLPPKDPDMISGPRPVLVADGDDQYSSIDDIMARAQPEPIADDDWNSADDEFDDFDDWD